MNTRARRSFCILLLLALAITGAAAQQLPASEARFAGRWEATEGLPSAPWVFDLVSAGPNKVSGRVFQHGGTAGPVNIYGGQISGEAIMFKANAPVESTVKRIITFTGRLSDKDLVFTRDVEVIATGPEPTSYENGMFSATGPKQFKAKRTGAAVLPLVSIESPKEGAPPADVTGRWESIRMTQDKWVIDLKADYATVTGTVTVNPGSPERRDMVDRNPRNIFDGRIEGNTLTFKVNSYDNVRTIHVTGKVQGNEIAFTRWIQTHNINGQRPFGVEDIYGVSAPFAWVGRRRHEPSAAERKLKEDMEANRFKWAGRTFKKYEFTVEFDCGPCLFSASAPMTFRVDGVNGVSVTDTSSTSSSPQPPTPGAGNPAGPRGGQRGAPAAAAGPAGAGAVTRFATMDRYMEVINDMLQLQPYSAKVAFDPTYGFLTSAELLSGIAVDDSIKFKVTDFKVLD